MKAVFVLVATVLSLSSISYADECPVKFPDVVNGNVTAAFESNFDYTGEVIKKIRAAGSCEEASRVAESCAMGSGIDPAMTVVAERKCGLDFWKKLTNAEKSTYNSLQGKCDAKYAKQQGSMYVSFSAFCRLNVARLYSELNTPVDDAL